MESSLLTTWVPCGDIPQEAHSDVILTGKLPYMLIWCKFLDFLHVFRLETWKIKKNENGLWNTLNNFFLNVGRVLGVI